MYPVRVFLACVLCVAAAVIAPCLAAGGTITVYSYPANATVTLNGDVRGLTPLVLRDVPPGEYEIGISLTGFRNESFSVRLNEGSTRDIGVNLEDASVPAGLPGNGSIAVDSVPGGASVLLDGKPAGTTPETHAALVIDRVPAGLHTITVEHAGFPSWSGNVTVPKNRVVLVNANLSAPPTATPAPSPVPVNATAPAGPAESSPAGTMPSTRTTGTPATPLPPVAAILAAAAAALAAAYRRS